MTAEQFAQQLSHKLDREGHLTTEVNDVSTSAVRDKVSFDVELDGETDVMFTVTVEQV